MAAPGADPLARALAEVVGSAHVLTEPDLRAPYEVDWTRRYRGDARAVVRPGCTEEVAGCIAVCADAGVAVVPQGGNTGLVGGGVPRGGEVVLSLQRMARVDPVDGARGEVVVEAGATLAAVQTAARAAGWDVGVDLGARGSCTIGGMVATNAGGIHLVRYGPMAHQLVGVEAVTGSGARVGKVPALRKDNTGYRWAGLLCGSEGTLAVVTRVHLALVPRLDARVVALVGTEGLVPALEVAAAMRRAAPSLLALEGFFAEGVDLVVERLGIGPPFPERWPAYLLVELAGGDGTDDRLLAELARGLDAAGAAVGATAVAVARPDRDRLWTYREGHTEAINQAGVPHKLDVTVPGPALPEFADRVHALVAEQAPEARTYLFGHVGDGNLHVNVLGLAPDDPTVDDAVLALVAELGGSISAEHGIGVAKRDLLGLARSPDDVAAMQAVKGALDPGGVLNPGVLLPAPPRPERGGSALLS